MDPKFLCASLHMNVVILILKFKNLNCPSIGCNKVCLTLNFPSKNTFIEYVSQRRGQIITPFPSNNKIFYCMTSNDWF